MWRNTLLVRSQSRWFKTLIRWRESVIPSVMPRVLVCVGFGVLITLLHQLGWPVALPILSGIVPSIVLGLLLVFRTNTAYERFWEGRKLWGKIVNTSRNLVRQIWVSVEVANPHEQETKQQALRLVVGFAIATKLLLREDPLTDELKPFLSPAQFQKLYGMNNPPLEIAFWLGDYLQVQQVKGNIHPYRLQAMTDLLDALVDAMGSCERILRTPIPMAYAIHLKQMLLVYCLALPFQIVNDIGWWTGPIVGLVTFAVFGIEEIGIEIENPFGRDPNDLPLDEICQIMLRNMEDVMTLTPGIEKNTRQAWQITSLKSKPIDD